MIPILGAAVLAFLPTVAPAQLPGYEIVPLGRGSLNRLRLAATIEGTKGLLVLDTGAGGTFLSQAKYSSLLPGGDRQLPAGVPKDAGFNGIRVPVGYARDFHIGNANLGSLPLKIVPQRYLYDAKLLYAPQSDTQYDGYLGEDILRHYNAIVDVGRLALYLNMDPKRRTNPGRGLVAAGWTRIPMTASHGDFTVECVLGTKKFRLFVDTGSPFTVLDERVVRSSQAAVADIPMKGGVVATRAREMGMVMTNSLSIGSYTATGVHLVSEAGLQSSMGISSEAAVPLGGLLGGDILARNNAMIDIGNQALYLKPPGAATNKP